MNIIETKMSERDKNLLATVAKFVPKNFGILINNLTDKDIYSVIISNIDNDNIIYGITHNLFNKKCDSNQKHLFINKLRNLPESFIYNNIFLYIVDSIDNECDFIESLNRILLNSSENLVACGKGYKNPYYTHVQETILRITKEHGYYLYKADDIWCILKCKNMKLQSELKSSGMNFIVPAYREYINNANGVSPIDVIYAYRILLKRLPEDDDAIAVHLGAPSLEALVQTIKNSVEYQNMN